MDFKDVPKMKWTIINDGDFDLFIQAHTGKKWSVQQSLLDCDNQAGNGVVNDFEAYYDPENEYDRNAVSKVEVWLTTPPHEPFHVAGRWEHENVTTTQILTWLVYKGVLPEGEYKIRNYW